MANTDLQATCNKVSSLVELAASAQGEEGRTAALTATQIMKENDLVVVPRSELARIKQVVGDAAALATRAKVEKRNNLIMGAALGVFASKSGFLGK
jgi:hypothetical protein